MPLLAVLEGSEYRADNEWWRIYVNSGTREAWLYEGVNW